MFRFCLSLTAIAACTLLSASADAQTRAGTNREALSYENYVTQKGFFVCPEGTKRTFQDSTRGLEETCMTADGTKHGYYIRWHENGDHWAEVGEYVQGRKAGKWQRFTIDGREIKRSRASVERIR